MRGDGARGKVGDTTELKCGFEEGQQPRMLRERRDCDLIEGMQGKIDENNIHSSGKKMRDILYDHPA